MIFLVQYPLAQPSIQVPGSLVQDVGNDAIFQWNSTKEILAAEWGFTNSGENKLAQRFIYIDKFTGPIVDSGVAQSPYRGRVSFLGNLSRGNAWFKLSNLTFRDTRYYGAKILEKGSLRYNFHSVHLTVLGNMLLKMRKNGLLLYLNKTTMVNPNFPKYLYI